MDNVTVHSAGIFPFLCRASKANDTAQEVCSVGKSTLTPDRLVSVMVVLEM